MLNIHRASGNDEKNNTSDPWEGHSLSEWVVLVVDSPCKTPDLGLIENNVSEAYWISIAFHTKLDIISDTFGLFFSPHFPTHQVIGVQSSPPQVDVVKSQCWCWTNPSKWIWRYLIWYKSMVPYLELLSCPKNKKMGYSVQQIRPFAEQQTRPFPLQPCPRLAMACWKGNVPTWTGAEGINMGRSNKNARNN